jgi:hypothetical protein
MVDENSHQSLIEDKPLLPSLNNPQQILEAAEEFGPQQPPEYPIDEQLVIIDPSPTAAMQFSNSQNNNYCQETNFETVATNGGYDYYSTTGGQSQFFPAKEEDYYYYNNNYGYEYSQNTEGEYSHGSSHQYQNNSTEQNNGYFYSQSCDPVVGLGITTNADINCCYSFQ